MGQITIAVVNLSSVVADCDIELALPHLQRHVAQTVPAGWQLSVALRFAKDKKRTQHEWLLAILDGQDQAEALGLRYMTEDDLPRGLVFAQSSHRNWLMNARVELLEMLSDPIIGLMALDEDPSFAPLCATQ